MCNDECGARLTLLLIGLLVGFLFGGLAGEYEGEKSSQRQAVAAGVAYYAVDPATGETWLVYGEGGK